MNRKLKCLFVAGLAAVTLFLFGSQTLAASPVLDVDLSAGYRVDQLQWNISGTSAGTNPNILSEVTWEELKVFQLQHRGHLNLRNENHRNMEAELSWLVGYGQINSGSNQDSDYAGDNRTFEWSRSNNSADVGSVLDLSAALGFKFFGKDASSYFLPRFGLSLNEQRLTMTDGRQTLSNQAIADAVYGPGNVSLPPLGPIAGLDSSYDTRWVGPWLGFKVQKEFGGKLSLDAGFEYHWADFEAEANWNLRGDLKHPVSFRHDGDGTGKVYELGAEYRLDDRWALRLNGKYQDWRIISGVDTVFQVDGSRSVAQLREVSWESYEFMAGIRHRF